MKSIPQLFATFVLSLVLCSSVSGQSTGQISGTITDQTGMALPGATIKLTQMDTGTAQSTITDQAGFYLLSNLLVGPYRLEVVSQGFRSYVRTGIHLEMAAGSVLNIQMNAGQATDQVEVQASAPLAQTRSSSAGQVFDNQQVVGVPLNGRNVVQLFTLGGAAVATATLNIASGLGYGTGSLSPRCGQCVSFDR